MQTMFPLSTLSLKNNIDNPRTPSISEDFILPLSQQAVNNLEERSLKAANWTFWNFIPKLCQLVAELCQRFFKALPPPEENTFFRRKLESLSPEKLSNIGELESFFNSKANLLKNRRLDKSTLSALLPFVTNNERVYIHNLGEDPTCTSAVLETETAIAMLATIQSEAKKAKKPFVILPHINNNHITVTIVDTKNSQIYHYDSTGRSANPETLNLFKSINFTFFAGEEATVAYENRYRNQEDHYNCGIFAAMFISFISHQVASFESSLEDSPTTDLSSLTGRAKYEALKKQMENVGNQRHEQVKRQQDSKLEVAFDRFCKQIPENQFVDYQQQVHLCRSELKSLATQLQTVAAESLAAAQPRGVEADMPQRPYLSSDDWIF